MTYYDMKINILLPIYKTKRDTKALQITVELNWWVIQWSIGENNWVKTKIRIKYIRGLVQMHVLKVNHRSYIHTQTNNGEVQREYVISTYDIYNPEKVHDMVLTGVMWWILDNKHIHCKYVDVIQDLYIME